MTLFILKDYPELQYDAAIEKSMAMMSGHKMKMFLSDRADWRAVLICKKYILIIIILAVVFLPQCFVYASDTDATKLLLPGGVLQVFPQVFPKKRRA